MRLSNPALEGIMHVSKALKHQILIDVDEMQDLFSALGDFSIYNVSEIVGLDFGLIPHAAFLENYATYINTLKAKVPVNDSLHRRYFSSIFTTTQDVLYAQEVKPEKYLIKTIRPTLQLQLHRFSFSSLDEKFHPMVLGKDSVSWGIQFSYPQVFQDPQTHAFSKITDAPEFPNTALYKKFALWIRANTLPSPFIYQGKRLNAPFRLGRKCFDWINLEQVCK